MATVNTFPLETTPFAAALQSINFLLYRTTSASSLAIGTGTKVFTVEEDKDFPVGAFVLAVSAASSANFMIGQVVSYAGPTLTLNVTSVGGSGTHADWTVLISGPPGSTGATGPTGPTGPAGSMGGPVSSTDNAVTRFDGAGGTQVQNSNVQIDDTGNLFPNTTDVGALGISTKMWADLFLASGGVINFNAGNYTITHSAGDLAFSGIVTLMNSGLHVLDTDASHDLIIKPGSNLTADRTLTLTTGDADRTLTLSGNATLVAGTAAVLAGTQTLTGGFTAMPFSAGTKSSGTYTPLYSDGNFQYATNGGAHTLAPPANVCTMVVEYVNNASAGAVTTSSFSKVTGDTITTTNGHKFFFFIVRHQTYSHLHVQALQ